jgi:putative nucleotidyltransferase with HDIG domain
MLVAIMISGRLAKIMGLLLPLCAFVAGAFELDAYIFALVSGVSAIYVLRDARQRMDMVRAGAFVAVINVAVAVGIALFDKSALEKGLITLFWAAFNGVASGMLVLGITPLLEKCLHSATTFRLIELLDLGNPLLRQLAQKTPGTFAHSMLVAALAEAACKEIGARALLARVGGYYHDIGKMDNPQYFVENQQNHENRHDDLSNPRLSATVIRSHVKLGVEKGRAFGLPDEVIDIINSHHGNSLIAYFYYEAVKREGEVTKEDFCYPGHPPRTKEAACVMLADITEAATRTLDKPSASRLEKFIDTLIGKKMSDEQLADSDLTFRDLETIKRVFTRTLASYYHSRIEYPKDPADTDAHATT